MIASNWKNICTVVTSVVLLLFGMIQIILALALNLRANMWVDPAVASSAAEDKTKLTTGINILIDALFVFPAAWCGICAAVSRNRGVYIALIVIACLAFLSVIGGLVDIAYEFSAAKLFADANSVNDELAISLVVMQSMLVIITVFLMIFSIIGVLDECPDHPKYQDRKELMVEEPPRYPVNTVQSVRGPSYAASYAGYTAPAAATYRQYTKGSPEWDRFYSQYFGTSSGSYGADKRKSSKYRSSSYRY